MGGKVWSGNCAVCLSQLVNVSTVRQTQAFSNTFRHVMHIAADSLLIQAGPDAFRLALIPPRTFSGAPLAQLPQAQSGRLRHPLHPPLIRVLGHLFAGVIFTLGHRHIATLRHKPSGLHFCCRGRTPTEMSRGPQLLMRAGGQHYGSASPIQSAPRRRRHKCKGVEITLSRGRSYIFRGRHHIGQA